MAPTLQDALVIELVNQVSYFPDTRSLVIQTRQSERGTNYILNVEIRSMALREIWMALKTFSEKTGTSIEDLTTPNSVQ